MGFSSVKRHLPWTVPWDVDLGASDRVKSWPSSGADIKDIPYGAVPAWCWGMISAQETLILLLLLQFPTSERGPVLYVCHYLG